MVQGSHFDDATPERLAELLHGEMAAPVAWTPRDLEAIYRHQLATPLQLELGAMAPDEAKQLAATADAHALLLRSIGDLLHHPRPPVALLAMLKDFAKRLMEHPLSALPHDVAALLYWASIAAGLRHGGMRLTSLDDGRLITGLQWAASQPWVDPPTAEMIRAAVAALRAGGAGHDQPT